MKTQKGIFDRHSIAPALLALGVVSGVGSLLYTVALSPTQFLTQKMSLGGYFLWMSVSIFAYILFSAFMAMFVPSLFSASYTLKKMGDGGLLSWLFAGLLISVMVWLMGALGGVVRFPTEVLLSLFLVTVFFGLIQEFAEGLPKKVNHMDAFVEVNT